MLSEGGLEIFTLSIFCFAILKNSLEHYKKRSISLSEIKVITELVEKLVQVDEGGRGIIDILSPPGSLYNAANCILESKSIAIITGFPCMLDYSPPTETDGPLGSMCLARTLLTLQKDVVIITDECNEEILLACAAASNLITPRHPDRKVLRMESFPPKKDLLQSEIDLHRLMTIAESTDLVIAVERTGPNKEGKYLTMRFAIVLSNIIMAIVILNFIQIVFIKLL